MFAPLLNYYHIANFVLTLIPHPTVSERHPHLVDTMSFSGLPLELKQEIWQLALSAAAAEPEVCLLWPVYQTDFDQIPIPLVVDTAFPVLMHVCREWRSHVLSWSRRPSFESPVRFRFSRQAGCQVPYRLFRGSTDALYASFTNFDKAFQAMYWESGTIDRQTLASVRHLAVEWVVWTRVEYWLPELVFWSFPDLKKVSVVFPSSRRAIWHHFQAPAKRCKLRRVEGPEGIVAERNPGEMVSIQGQVDYGRDLADELAPVTWQNELDLYEMGMGEPGGKWFVGSAWDKEQEKFCLQYEAAAFVQYKRTEDSEAWVEACEDRLLVQD